MKKCVGFLCVLLIMSSLCSACSVTKVTPGNYYLDNDNDDCNIKIIDNDTLRLVGFDADYLTNYLIHEGTDFRGDDAKVYRENHNLPDVFYGEIAYEFNENELYLQALSSENVDYYVVNYRMSYENNTITFLENTYTRR